MDSLRNRVVLLLILFGSAFCTASESHLRKRSDDSNPLEEVVNRLTQTVAALEAKVQALETAGAEKAAFRGVTLVNPNAIVGQTPIKFHASSSQPGGGYDSTLGVYTAPLSGWYTVHARLYLSSAAEFWLDVYQNGHIASRVKCRSDVDFTCSSGVSLHVEAGDRLWLQADSYSGACYNAEFDNVFSIVLASRD